MARKSKNPKKANNASKRTNEEANKALWDAIYKSDLNGARSALENGADVNAKQKNGYTPLMMAIYVRENGEELVRLLLEYKPDMSVKDHRGETAFLMALRPDKLDIAELLLEKGANVNDKYRDGATALISMVRCYTPEPVKLLLKYGANVNARDAYKNTALMKAAKEDKLEIAELLLQKCAKVDARDIRGYTPLMVAAYHNHTSIVKLLIEHKANVNARGRVGEYNTPLLCAAIGFSSGSVRLLIDHEAKLNVKSKGGETLLMLCARIGDLDLVKLLVEKGFNVNARSKNGNTPLMEAVEHSGDLDIAKFLLERGARVNVKNKEGETPLSIAKGYNNTDMVELLLAHSANEANNATIGFEDQLWNTACVLWGHISATEYRKVIIGLIFLRYISAAFEKRYAELVAEGEGDEDDPLAYIEKNIFFVPETARWAKIAAAAHEPEIGVVIDEAMLAIEKENKTLKDVLPKNYASPEIESRVLGNVVDLFTNMDMTETSDSKDLLGRTYEYCIAQFAAKEGKKGGEFYTPSSIVKTIVEILKPTENSRVYDPCCGSGGMFVQSVKFLQSHSQRRNAISVYGQESNADTWRMAKMNMAIRGIDADFGEHQADTFFRDLHSNLRADFIMANPPFNLSAWGQDKLKDDVRWRYGLPPAGNANFAWIQHMIHHLAPNGKIGLVLANGALSSQSSGEGEIRKKIIEDDLIEGIVALPTQLFYSVTIPVTLWFISKNKKQKGKTVFIDARKMGFMVDRKHRDFSDDDIAKIASTFEAFQNGTLANEEGFCAVATTADIAAQDYVLTPGRYVGIAEEEDDGEPFDEKMKRLTGELSEMFAKSNELEKEIRKSLKALGYEV